MDILNSTLIEMEKYVYQTTTKTPDLQIFNSKEDAENKKPPFITRNIYMFIQLLTLRELYVDLLIEYEDKNEKPPKFKTLFEQKINNIT